MTPRAYILLGILIGYGLALLACQRKAQASAPKVYDIADVQRMERKANDLKHERRLAS
jgi:hypothetical protein